MSLKSLIIGASSLGLICGAAIAMDPPAEKKPESVPAKKIVPVKEDKDEKKAEITLKIGDKAPAINVEKWVKGDEVKGFESGKVYVVEFWATWCPPCRKAIPHLTELQKEHKDTVFIGVAGSERKKGDKDTRLEVLEKFVKDQGDSMGYRVAYDSKRAMPDTWLRPAGRNGIPCSFVVDGEGKISWIGNPLSNNGEDLAEAVADAEKRAKTKA